MSTTSRHIKKGQDRVSNGRLVPGRIDLRSAHGRRMRRLVEAYTAELGDDVELSEVDQALIRQAASLTLASERLAAEVVGGQPINGDQLVRISSELRRRSK
jgi:hypothetical protein